MTRSLTDPEPPLTLHVRCLKPYCGREAIMDPAHVFDGWEALPPAGLSRRFLCTCGGRAAHISYQRGRPKRDNPCGWL